MMTLEEVRAIADKGEYSLIPVAGELLSDVRTPMEVLKRLMNVSDHCFLLESSEDNRKWGRYTFLGYDPVMEITCTDKQVTINSGGAVRMESDHPDEYIRQILSENKAPRLPELPPFTGGLVGYFSYEYFQYAEPKLYEAPKETPLFPDFDLMLFDKLIAFDHYLQKIWLIVNLRTKEALETEYQKALLKIDEMRRIILHGEEKKESPGHLTSPLQPKFSEEEYARIVERGKEHIYEGDAFQLVLSNPMRADYEGSLLNCYRVLRTTNPSPYMFYFSGKIEIAGASPETLVKVVDGEVQTFPLAGTRKRGLTDAEDRALEEELLADEKECAEHNMLVDLGRNDLGRVSKFGSVHVSKYMQIERYSHVMHIGSEVTGTLRDDLCAIDALNAVLPAGTLSGAPKVRACEIIHALEGDRRGIYGGAIGYIDFTGNLDTCIAIRLAYKKDNTVYVRSGAGIVADSDPEKEYAECLNKAKAVSQALSAAGEMTKGEML